MSGPRILTVQDLHLHFDLGRHRLLKAVNGVDLQLCKGEILGLAGESGCGKSTLIRAILQLLRPTSGSVTFADRELTALRGNALRETRRHMQLIFQDPFASLNPRMKVGSIITEPLVNFDAIGRSDIQQRTAELMEMVGLNPAWTQRYPHEFSGGQRQRIGIARALALGPQILFCDEPVSSLDVSVQAQIINLLKDLQERLQLSMVFISHDLSVIRHISDRVAIMYLGKIVESAGAAKIYSAAKHPYTRALLSAIPVPDPRVERVRERILLTGDLPSPTETRPGCDFASRCPLAEPRCLEQAPLFREVDSGHAVACWLA